MSDITIACPSCNQELEVPQELLGQVVECASCEQSIQLPSPAPSSAAPKKKILIRKHAATLSSNRRRPSRPTATARPHRGAAKDGRSARIISILIILACFIALLLIISDCGAPSYEPAYTMPQPTRRTAVPAKRQKEVSLISYRILKREAFLHHKVSYDILVYLVDGRLPNKKELTDISKHLRSSSHDRTFVCFYLPGMVLDSGAFASAHHTPKMEVQIYPSHVPDQYATLLMKDQQRTVKEKPISDSEKVLGRWVEKAPVPAIVTFLDRNGSVFMTKLFDDGSRGDYEMIARKVGSQTRYSKKGNKTSDYVIITPDGSLAHGDDEGIWQTSQRLK